MSFFSVASETALRLLTYVNAQTANPQKLSVQEIAVPTGTPVTYAAKILQILARKGLLSSTRGPHGGFYLDHRQMNQVTAYQVVVAMDGDSMFSTCLLGLKDCTSSRPCPMHDEFTLIRQRLTQALQQTSLAALAERYKSGQYFVSSDDIHLKK